MAYFTDRNALQRYIYETHSFYASFIPKLRTNFGHLIANPIEKYSKTEQRANNLKI